MNRLISIDRNALAETLHYGSPLNSPRRQPSLPFSEAVLQVAAERRKKTPHDKSALLAEGARLWTDVCRKTAEDASHPLLLPLSAGLDSRAVLAGLRGCGADVHTVTYGLPGAFDYDIAPHVARCADVTNEQLDLKDVRITRRGLLDLARRAEHPSLLIDMLFNHQIAASHGRNFSYVNGFVGDALAGNNLKIARGFQWTEATRAFAQWHRSSRTVTLTNPDMDPVAALPAAPFVDPALLPSIQQLDYAVRQQMLVRPIVCPPDVEVFTPFLDPEWCVFMLGLPEALRKNRAFFIELFQKSYPQLFSLPTTASGGLSLGASDTEIRRYRKRLRRGRRMRARLNRVFPKVRVPPANRAWQYLDFRTLLREDSDLYELFAESLARLDEQRVVPWIDASALLRAHRAHEADHFKALNVLFNLELLLDARPELFAPTD